MAAPRPGGNTRTGQDREFQFVDKVLRTREVFDANEKSAHHKDDSIVAVDPGGMDVTDEEQRMGRPMTSSQLMGRLRTINPNFRFEVSKADQSKYGIYLLHRGQKMFLCGMENTSHWAGYGQMPEFSIIETAMETRPGPNGEEKVKKFDAERRGWRTVVAILLLKRIITPYDVEKHFGIVPSKDSARWHELMFTKVDLMNAEVAYGKDSRAIEAGGRGGDPRGDGPGDRSERPDADDDGGSGVLDKNCNSGGEGAFPGGGGEAGERTSSPRGSSQTDDCGSETDRSVGGGETGTV